MSKPGQGASPTTGEAAARRNALEEALAIVETPWLTQQFAAERIRALMDRAPDDPPEAMCEDQCPHGSKSRARIAELEREATCHICKRPHTESGASYCSGNHWPDTVDRAFQRGAEAMREAAARDAETFADEALTAARIRALPLPDEKMAPPERGQV